jgi:cytochrome c oxidase subunit III
MAHAADIHAPSPPVDLHAPTPTEYPKAFRSGKPPAPVSPGKVAMWLFLATEVMFFTGLIGSYIVLRSGSPPTAYSNQYPPATYDKEIPPDATAVVVEDLGPNRSQAISIIEAATGLSPHDAERLVEGLPLPVKTGVTKDEAQKLLLQLEQAGAKVKTEGLVFYQWPKPYKLEVNPLSINLTALNTFILICSSVSMVLALSAIQRGEVWKLRLYMMATVVIGSIFLGIQVYEYYHLIWGRYFPIGISADSHFRPSSSLFASCFFTMTGFHGAHVLGGVILLSCITIQAWLGTYTQSHHSPVELAGLYWHFVDLVWIILFTVVYLI